MDKVENKLEIFTIDDPLQRPPADDPWREFRSIEKIGLERNYTYRHSLGKCSKFFIELENKRFFATECPRCGKVWAPPRAVCPADLTITGWKELSGKGKIEAFSVSDSAPAFYPLETPYVLAYVALEGASTLFLQQLRNYGDPGCIEIGMPVKAVYADGPVPFPHLLMWFEPD